jgi:putative intracellular protease/amidase
MKVLLVTTSTARYQNHDLPTGLWLSEITHLFDACVQQGISPVIVSIHGGPVALDPECLKPLVLDKISQKYHQDPEWMALLHNTLSIDSVEVSEYDAIYLAGGHGTMYDFVGNARLNALVAAFYRQKKLISAVCHGVCGLLDVQLDNGDYLIKGKKLTGYSWFEETLASRKKQVPFNLEHRLKERGALYAKSWIPLAPHVEVDQNLMTGQNPFSSKSLAQKIIAQLQS